MRDTAGITVDEIKLEQIDRTGIRSPQRWRGRLFDTLDLYVATEKQFLPTAAGTNTGHIIATIPKQLMGQRHHGVPARHLTPRRHKPQAPLPAGSGGMGGQVIETKYIWAKTYDSQA